MTSVRRALLGAIVPVDEVGQHCEDNPQRTVRLLEPGAGLCRRMGIGSRQTLRSHSSIRRLSFHNPEQLPPQLLFASVGASLVKTGHSEIAAPTGHPAGRLCAGLSFEQGLSTSFGMRRDQCGWTDLNINRTGQNAQGTSGAWGPVLGAGWDVVGIPDGGKL